MNRVTLKNVKHAAFASEETACFQATVYFDGKRVGVVSNEGRGGCDLWDDVDRAQMQKLKDYAASLPAEPCSWTEDDGSQAMLAVDAEMLVAAALDDYLTERDLKRHLSGKVLYLRDGAIYQTKRVGAAAVERWLSPAEIEHVLSVLKVTRDAVLNLMPFDKALATYKEKAA